MNTLEMAGIVMHLGSFRTRTGFGTGGQVVKLKDEVGYCRPQESI